MSQQITNYTQLQAVMAGYMKRQDLSALIPTFIGIAETWLDQNVYTQARWESYTVTPTQAVFNLPSDYKRVIAVYVLGETIDFFPTNFDGNYANGTIPAIGNGYQLINEQLVLNVPTLGLTQIDYYTTLEGLSATNPTNWLLEDSPDLYLWACLREAAVYMRDDMRLQAWEQLRDAALAATMTDDDASRRPVGTPLTIRAG